VYDKHENALRIPRSALVQEAGEPSVFVVSDGTAYRRVVQTGYVEAGQIEIVGGLSDGEQFVLVGQTGLKDGSKVSVINSPGAESGATGSSVFSAQ
jgi:membrane fusion protein, multidrug efflux system